MSETRAIRRALIPAAGMGTRMGLGPDTEAALPKPLTDFAGKPLLTWIIEALARNGITHTTLVAGWSGEALAAYAAQRPVKGMSIDIVWNDEWRKSNGLSVLKAKVAIDEPFVLLMSDHVFEDKLLGNLLKADLGEGEVILAVDKRIDEVFDIDDATKVVTDGDQIVAIDKALDDYNAVDCGMFLCQPALFDALEEALVDGDCSLSDGMRLLGARSRFRAHDIGDAFWQDVDTPEMFAHAEGSVRRLG